jgi:hypothetical protein
LTGSSLAPAAQITDVRPLTDEWVVVTFREGKVMHHGLGQKRSEEKVVGKPIDRDLLLDPSRYSVRSGQSARAIAGIGLKSKGTDFAWMVESWENGRAVNRNPDHVKTHWVYVKMPTRMVAGKRYALNIRLGENAGVKAFRFDPMKVRSEAVHVNAIGYAPDAPAKYAYLYHWMGDRGGLDLKPWVGRKFWLVDEKTGKKAFEGKIRFRKGATNVETQQTNDTPNANFQGADVYECDFSAFRGSGNFVVAVEKLGCSFPFAVNADAYRPAFVTIARGLYHNRSGIELRAPYTKFPRPAPHHPVLTPDWRGKLQYSTLSVLDYGNESSDRATLEPTLKGPLEAWGWYQDAGDWDSYPSHLRVAQELLLAYELNPKAFTDGELNIPESGNGVPDILDEAAWLPRFCHRLRHELLRKKYGTGGLGLRVAGDAFGSDGEGKPSWKDTDRIYVASGEDPLSTFTYAGAAAHLARCLKLAGKKDPEGVDWEREALECFEWGKGNTPERHEAETRSARSYAAAALYHLTGDQQFLEEFDRATPDLGASTMLTDRNGPGVYLLCLANASGPAAKKAQDTLRFTADSFAESANRRALRWGGDWGFPMLVGQQTTPLVMPLAVAAQAFRSDAARAKRYRSVLYTTADYFLGTNSLNMVWSTGLGPRHPEQVFHMDAWYNTRGGVPHPGIIPYGPWRKDKAEGDGPWDKDWPNKTVYPAIDLWPGAERYFDNRCAPMTGEFTVHQNTGPAAALYGILCAPRR